MGWCLTGEICQFFCTTLNKKKVFFAVCVCVKKKFVNEKKKMDRHLDFDEHVYVNPNDTEKFIIVMNNVEEKENTKDPKDYGVVDNNVEFIDMSSLFSDNKTSNSGDFDVPHNSRNSCYLDSTIVALLAVPNVFTSSYIIGKKLKARASGLLCITNSRDDLHNRREIQREIVKITRRMRRERAKQNTTPQKHDNGIFSLHVLRLLLARCNLTYDFNDGTQGDASEFLLSLASIFELNEVNDRFVDVFATNDVMEEHATVLTLTSTRTEKCGILHRVTPVEWSNIGDMSLFLRKVTDSGPLSDPLRVQTTSGETLFHRIITKERTVPNHFITIHLDRTDYATSIVNRTPFVCTEKTQVLVTSESNNLKLVFIVLHNGITRSSGHYTCLFRTEFNTWKFYDDLRGISNVSVDSFVDMCTEYKVAVNGVLFGYAI